MPPTFAIRTPPPADSAPPRRGIINPAAVVLALVVAGALVPWTYQYQSRRLPPLEKRAWRMPGLVNITQTQAVARFGKPLSAKDYSLADGSFIGQRTGLKRFVPASAPGYAERFQVKGAAAWTFPQFTTVRELIWKLPDSYLTIWFHQPRAEIDFRDGRADLTLPPFEPSEWVALDNYRLGKDLVAAPAH